MRDGDLDAECVDIHCDSLRGRSSNGIPDRPREPQASRRITIGHGYRPEQTGRSGVRLMLLTDVTDDCPTHRAGRASTTSRSSPPTWTPPCASTSACSACALVATTMAGPMRHYFFEMGRGNTVAFFEVEGAETFAKPAGGPSDRAIQLDHISFDVPDEHALEMLRKRLLAAGSEVTDGRRPRLHPLGLLHRPERHRARSVVVGRRRHRPSDRLHRRGAVRRPRPGPRGRRAHGRRPRRRARTRGSPDDAAIDSPSIPSTSCVGDAGSSPASRGAARASSGARRRGCRRWWRCRRSRSPSAGRTAR